MGKWGGWELNYASDIDLLFVYGVPEDEDPAAAGERAQRLAAAFLDCLGRRTPEGLAYRVDADLRPEGRVRSPGPHRRLLPGLLGEMGPPLGAAGPHQGPRRRRRPGPGTGLPRGGRALRVPRDPGPRRGARGARHEGPRRGDGGSPRGRDQARRGRPPRRGVRRPVAAIGPREGRPLAAPPSHPRGAPRPGRRRLRGPRRRRRPGGCLPLAARRGASPATRRTAAHPPDPRRRRRPGPPGQGHGLPRRPRLHRPRALRRRPGVPPGGGARRPRAPLLPASAGGLRRLPRRRDHHRGSGPAVGRPGVPGHRRRQAGLRRVDHGTVAPQPAHAAAASADARLAVGLPRPRPRPGAVAAARGRDARSRRPDRRLAGQPGGGRAAVHPARHQPPARAVSSTAFRRPWPGWATTPPWRPSPTGKPSSPRPPAAPRSAPAGRRPSPEGIASSRPTSCGSPPRTWSAAPMPR